MRLLQYSRMQSHTEQQLVVDRDLIVAIRSQPIQNVSMAGQRINSLEVRLCQLQEGG